MSGPVCSAKSVKAYTNINVWGGAELAASADPLRLLLVEGGKMRHLRPATVDDLRPAALAG